MSNLRRKQDMTGQLALTLPPVEESTDRELLERFVIARQESAFAVLVGRHGADVLRVCRRVLRNEHDAEDVLQATFLVLLRKAAFLPWQESIKHWLQTVALRLALQARTGDGRRRDREGVPLTQIEEEPSGLEDETLVEVARRELRLILDEELGRLPEKYRAPVVLCYLEGKTNEQAAGELGWPTGSMSRRLARARALLHDRLSRRGLVLLVVLCCLALAARGLLRPSVDRPAVARAMTLLGPARDGGDGFEQDLLHLSSGRHGWAEQDRERLTSLARRTAAIAGSIHDHDPGHRREQWRRLSGEMRRSALDLASTLASGDEQTIPAKARRLIASCQNCHATFRD
jgi:RNA polymerase sigma-70 factor (ECF subfamily)